MMEMAFCEKQARDETGAFSMCTIALGLSSRIETKVIPNASFRSAISTSSADFGRGVGRIDLNGFIFAEVGDEMVIGD